MYGSDEPRPYPESSHTRVSTSGHRSCKGRSCVLSDGRAWWTKGARSAELGTWILASLICSILNTIYLYCTAAIT